MVWEWVHFVPRSQAHSPATTIRVSLPEMVNDVNSDFFLYRVSATGTVEEGAPDVYGHRAWQLHSIQCYWLWSPESGVWPPCPPLWGPAHGCGG